jgi:hypothetical protein
MRLPPIPNNNDKLLAYLSTYLPKIVREINDLKVVFNNLKQYLAEKEEEQHDDNK